MMTSYRRQISRYRTAVFLSAATVMQFGKLRHRAKDRRVVIPVMLLILSVSVLGVMLGFLSPAAALPMSQQQPMSPDAPDIQVRKVANTDTAYPGETITYTYRVTNTGSVTLVAVTAVDDRLGPVPISATLHAEDVVTAILTYTVSELDLPGPLVNTVTVTGTPPSGFPITGTAVVTITLQGIVTRSLFLPLITSPAQWSQVGDMPAGASKFYDLAVCDDRYLAGADNGLYALGDTDWQAQTSVTGIVFGVTFVNADCSRAYAVSLGQGVWYGVYVSANGINGWIWSQVNSSGSDGEQVRSAVIRQNTLFIGGEFGIRWATIPALPQPHNWHDTTITTLTTGLNKSPGSDVIFASVWNNGVYVNTPDDNDAWDIQGDLADPLVYEAAGGADGQPRLAGTQSQLYLWDGTNWTETAPGFTNTTFAVAVIDDALYAGQRDVGVIVSHDDGQTWETMNTGLTMPAGEEFQVRGFFVSADGHTLYAATSSGVWRWPLR